MRQILDVPVLIAPALPRARSVDQTRATTPATKRVGLARVWREAFQTLVVHAAPILTLAFLGFALPMLLGLVVQRLHAFARRGEVVFIYDLPSPLAWAVQIVTAVVGLAFARGVITRIALHGEGCRAACHGALLRYPSLLFGSGLYLALALAGAVCAQVLLGVVGLDSLSVGTRAVNEQGATRISANHSLNALMVDVTVPGEWIDDLTSQSLLIKRWRYQVVPNQWEEEAHMLRSNDRGFWPAALGAGAMLAIAHVLLRFRTAAAFERGGANPLVALWRGLRVCAAHPGTVAAHGLLLRATLCLACAVFILAPIEASKAFAVSFLVSRLNIPGLRVTLEFVMTASLALVCACGWAFEAIYDARLYAAVRPEGWERA